MTLVIRILVVITLCLAGYVAIRYYEDERDAKVCEQEHIQVYGELNDGTRWYCRNHLR